MVDGCSEQLLRAPDVLCFMNKKRWKLVATRVEKAIHRSWELILESRMLEARNTVFLYQLKSEPEFIGYRTVRTEPDLGTGVVSSSLKWAVKAPCKLREPTWPTTG